MFFNLRIINNLNMSLTYAEIYQNKMRNKNKLSNENKINTNNTKNLKIISLIKKFPAKKRKTFETNINFKPRRIQSKSVQTIQKYRKTSSQKKETSKNNLDNNNKKKNENNNKNNKNTKKNQRKKNDIHDNNQIENNNLYKTEINTKVNSPKNNIKNKCQTRLSQTSKKNNQKNNYQENKENNDINIDTNDQNFNTVNFLEINKYNIPNKFDTISKSNKSSFNTLDTYFDIFRLRQQAANFKDKLKYNNINKYSSENDLNKVFNITRNNSEGKNKYQTIKSFSAFNQKKSKTYYKAIKLKEEIEKNIQNNNNINNQMYSSCKNFYNKNNEKDNEDNKNIVEEMTQHFFDKNEKRPKVMKKYLTQNGTFNVDKNNKNNIKTKIFSSNFNFYNNNNENCKNGEIDKNNLMTKFSSELYQMKYKRRPSLNNKSLNLIIEENQKLNNLLRKIPSNKDSKDRSYDLINYISQIRKRDNKIKYMKKCKYNFNNKFDVYPVNVWKQDFNTFE